MPRAEVCAHILRNPFFSLPDWLVHPSMTQQTFRFFFTSIILVKLTKALNQKSLIVFHEETNITWI